MMKLVPIFVVLLASCAGPSFETIKVPLEMTVIYLYSTDDVGAGQAAYVDSTVATPDADKKIIVFEDGYYPYLMAPGQVRVYTNGDSGTASCISFFAQTGASYYVRVRHRDDENLVELMDKSVAEPEISKTHLLPKESRTAPDKTHPTNDCLEL
jgi:hypothetical protein